MGGSAGAAAVTPLELQVDSPLRLEGSFNGLRLYPLKFLVEF